MEIKIDLLVTDEADRDMTRSRFVSEMYGAERAKSPLIEGIDVIRKLEKHFDDLHNAGYFDCSVECTPGNCAVEHHLNFYPCDQRPATARTSLLVWCGNPRHPATVHEECPGCWAVQR